MTAQLEACNACRDAQALKRGLLESFYRFVPEPRKTELIEAQMDDISLSNCADCFLLRELSASQDQIE
jgi:hypothetical protein